MGDEIDVVWYPTFIQCHRTYTRSIQLVKSEYFSYFHRIHVIITCRLTTVFVATINTLTQFRQFRRIKDMRCPFLYNICNGTMPSAPLTPTDIVNPSIIMHQTEIAVGFFFCSRSACFSLNYIRKWVSFHRYWMQPIYQPPIQKSIHLNTFESINKQYLFSNLAWYSVKLNDGGFGAAHVAIWFSIHSILPNKIFCWFCCCYDSEIHLSCKCN